MKDQNDQVISMLDPLTPTGNKNPGEANAFTGIPEHISLTGSILGVNGSSMVISKHVNSIWITGKDVRGFPQRSIPIKYLRRIAKGLKRNPSFQWSLITDDVLLMEKAVKNFKSGEAPIKSLKIQQKKIAEIAGLYTEDPSILATLSHYEKMAEQDPAIRGINALTTQKPKNTSILAVLAGKIKDFFSSDSSELKVALERLKIIDKNKIWQSNWDGVSDNAKKAIEVEVEAEIRGRTPLRNISNGTDPLRLAALKVFPGYYFDVKTKVSRLPEKLNAPFGIRLYNQEIEIDEFYLENGAIACTNESQPINALLERYGDFYNGKKSLLSEMLPNTSAESCSLDHIKIPLTAKGLSIQRDDPTFSMVPRFQELCNKYKADTLTFKREIRHPNMAWIMDAQGVPRQESLDVSENSVDSLGHLLASRLPPIEASSLTITMGSDRDKIPWHWRTLKRLPKPMSIPLSIQRNDPTFKGVTRFQELCNNYNADILTFQRQDSNPSTAWILDAQGVPRQEILDVSKKSKDPLGRLLSSKLPRKKNFRLDLTNALSIGILGSTVKDMFQIGEESAFPPLSIRRDDPTFSVVPGFQNLCNEHHANTLTFQRKARNPSKAYILDYQGLPIHKTALDVSNNSVDPLGCLLASKLSPEVTRPVLYKSYPKDLLLPPVFRMSKSNELWKVPPPHPMWISKRTSAPELRTSTYALKINDLETIRIKEPKGKEKEERLPSDGDQERRAGPSGTHPDLRASMEPPTRKTSNSHLRS